MSNIIEDIGKEILKFIFFIILAWFLFWTGEIVIYIISCGFHKPRWNGYAGDGSFRRVFSETIVGTTGFIFWLIAIPLLYDFISNLSNFT
jgi:hypothetical protein